MNVNEFVNKVFLRYPPDIKGDDTEEDLMLDYIKALSTGKEYDFENAFIDLMRSFRFKSLPTAKILLETLEQNEIKPEKNTYKKLEFPSLWAQKEGHWYEFGIEPEIGVSVTTRVLSRKGFINITNQNPYLSKYENGYTNNREEAQRAVCSL